jgi:hypothetical protein
VDNLSQVNDVAAHKFGNVTLDAAGVTAARTLTLPDKAGTLATTGDVAAQAFINAILFG